VIFVWVLSVLLLVSFVALTALWINVQRGYRSTSSRHSTWSDMVSQLPPGSRLTGIDAESQTVVEISPTMIRSLESHGGQ
jgi:hypothetical protein